MRQMSKKPKKFEVWKSKYVTNLWMWSLWWGFWKDIWVSILEVDTLNKSNREIGEMTAPYISRDKGLFL